MKMKRYVRVLTIAGSDTAGGAGQHADLKTFSALGCYGMTALTCIVNEDTLEVKGIYEIPADFVKAQIESVLSDIGVDAMKTGMLNSAPVVKAVAEAVRPYGVRNFVVDPVMVASGGAKLLQDDAVSALEELLIPQARLITPNHREGEVLLGAEIGEKDFAEAAVALSRKYGGVSVMLKAGHFGGPLLTDWFYNAEDGTLLELPSPKVHTPNDNGTGCTLSAAITASLAKGLPLTEAVKAGKDYVARAIVSGARYRLGAGRGPVNHLFANDL